MLVLVLTALTATAGPGIELLEYLAPGDGRPAPSDLRANDIAHWQTTLQAETPGAMRGRVHNRGARPPGRCTAGRRRTGEARLRGGRPAHAGRRLLHADPAVRFQRLKSRGRESDPRTFEEFLDLETREEGGLDSETQQLKACEAMADFKVNNTGSLEDLQGCLSSLLQEVNHQMVRPDWDEYFMNIAKVVSLRSNCLKRKVAAIIVRDRRVISTGYNGTPRGTRNCYEGGCPRCAGFADSGTRLEECLCSHGEENAITQAAYHGVSVKGGTLYSTFAPCLMCTKMIINAGIREVVYNQDYPLNETSFKLFQEAGVICRQHSVE